MASARVASDPSTHRGRRPVVLVDGYSQIEYLLPALSLAQILVARGEASRIVIFLPNRRTRLLVRLLVRSPRSAKIVILDDLLESIERYNSHAIDKWLSAVDPQEDPMSLVWGSVRLGQHAYESYLREGRPTGSLSDPVLMWHVRRAFALTLVWQHLFRRLNVQKVIVSHDCYSTLGPLVDVCEDHGTDTYWVSPTTVAKCVGGSCYWGGLLGRYRSRFEALPGTDKVRVREYGESLIANWQSAHLSDCQRFSNDHSFASAKPELPGSIFGVIAMHDFIDSPHSYGRMWFRDFWEWACFVAESTRDSDDNWYLRPHPAYGHHESTTAAVDALLTRYPHLKLMSANIPWGYLIEAGLRRVVSYYGSVGHELPILGLDVVLASPSPHGEFSFSRTAKTVGEYGMMIREPLNPKMPSGIKRSELAEFWGMHFKYRHFDDLFFGDYTCSCLKRDCGQWSESRWESYLLQSYVRNSSSGHLKKSLEKVDRFLDDGDSHLNLAME